MENFLKEFTEKDITYSLYGIFLGDGSYQSGKISTSHTHKQRFYCVWLNNIFKQYGINTKLRLDFIKKTTFGNVMYSETRIYVPKRFYFETLNKCFNNQGKKIVSEYVINNINEFGLLLWWLDDGCLFVKDSKRFGYLNTQGFTYEENILIKNMFKDRFDIELNIHKDNSGFENCKHKTYYRLYFNATNFRKFIDIVRPYLKYIPKEFYYKFNMEYKENRIKKSKEFSQLYNFI